MKKKITGYFLIVGLLSLVVTSCNPGKEPQERIVFDVADFGAKGDGIQLDTDAINKAIDSCHNSGGGSVYFSSGVFLSGSIHLRSHVDLVISPEATIMGASNDIGAYDPPEPNPWDAYQDFGHSHFQNALMWGEGLEDITITGGGTINGGGISRNDPPVGGGDKAISLRECNNITIKNLNIQQGGHFAILANACSFLHIDSVEIVTSRDGIDLMSCSNVHISRSKFYCIRHDESGKMAGGDDAIGIKSDYALGRKIDSDSIVISDCFLSSGTNAIQFGSETVGDIRNVYVSDCIIEHADKAGLGITTNDGSKIENVFFRNITMSKTAIPIFLLITDRGRVPYDAPVGEIRNIHFENIRCIDAYGYIKDRKFTSTLSGLPGFPIRDVKFKNLTITYKGGGKSEQASIEVPYTAEYAPRKLGVRPASAFYMRHAEGIKITDAEFQFESPDYRPLFTLKDLKGIHFDHITSGNAELVDPDVVLKDCEDFQMTRSDALTVSTESVHN